jgi:hypothetical protein
MKQNMGTTDRIVRAVLAALIVVLYYLGIIGGVWIIVLLTIGAIFLFTALIGFCPLYVLFGINTCKRKKNTIRN